MTRALYFYDTPRPVFSPLFYMAISAWLSTSIALCVLRVCALSTCRRVFIIACLFLVACILFSLRTKKHTCLIFLVLGLAFGCVSASFSSYVLHSQVNTFQQEQHLLQNIEIEVLSDPQSSYGTYRFLAKTDDISSLPVRISLTSSSESISFVKGSRYLVTVRIDPKSQPSSSFDWNQGIACKGKVLHAQVSSRFSLLQPLLTFRNNTIESLRAYETDEAYLLEALICGYRVRGNASDLMIDFRRCGLAHLVAVSGAHLVIVTGLLVWFGKFLHIPRRINIGCVIAGMISYLIVAGIPLSALRAAFMSCVALLAVYAKRRPSALNACALCILVVIGVNPRASVSISFLLSTSATLSIVIFSPLLSSAIKLVPFMRSNSLCDALSLTLAANISAMPLAASFFSQLPLLSLLTNLVCSPFVTAICATGLLASILSCICPIAGSVLGFAAYKICTLLCMIIRLLARIPYACVPLDISLVAALVIAIGLSAILYLFWYRKFGVLWVMTAVALFMATYVACLIFVPVQNRVVALDIGQGDAILVQSKTNSLLIDTGKNDTMLISALGRRGVAHLDGLLITHFDEDHCGSIQALRSVTEIDTVYLSKEVLSCDDNGVQQLLTDALHIGKQVCFVSPDDCIDIGDIHLEVCWPYSFADKGGNVDSVCLYGVIDSSSDTATKHDMLFTGDAEVEQIDTLLRERNVYDIDVLKVSHHGSKTGLTDDLADDLNPRVALISCGAHNRYGHPHKEVLSSLSKTRAAVFRTDISGDVTCEFYETGIRVRTQR